ncbi:MAG: high frequency lysogenization protein HflD [bacterium]
MFGDKFWRQPTSNQVVALSGIFQACSLVDTLARLGTAPEEPLQVCIDSLFVKNPDATESVFGGIANLETGRQALRRSLEGGHPESANIIRYAVGVVYLASRLRHQKPMLDTIGVELDRIDRQREHFSSLHENVINSLAELYQSTISTFSKRIQVNGYADNLQQPAVAAKIRCLLFAGIRSAILWHQLGGRRRHLFANRRKIVLLLEGL